MAIFRQASFTFLPFYLFTFQNPFEYDNITSDGKENEQ